MKYNQEVGIVYSEALRKRNGGPSTYLYNLKAGYRENKEKMPVVYANEMCGVGIGTHIMNFLATEIKKRKRKFLYKAYELAYILNQYEVWLTFRNKYKDAAKKKMLHFHSVLDLYMFQSLFHYKGKVILTMHTPEPFSDEVINFKREACRTDYSFPLIKKFLAHVENRACKRADAFIFPSKETEDIYNHFPFYRKNKKGKNIKYLITGTSVEMIKTDKETLKKSKKLPEDTFILLFMGRHSEIKGYDLLVQAFEQLCQYNITVLCGGKLNPCIKYPKSEKWIELGWRKDVAELISCADAVVLPNRNTYFDLAAIEALAQGRILVASDTGGTRTLAKSSNGVRLFEAGNVDDLVEKLLKVVSVSVEEKKRLEEENYQYYCENCTLQKFAKNYSLIIEECFDER